MYSFQIQIYRYASLRKAYHTTMNKSTSFQPVSGVVFSGIPSRCFPPFLAVWGGQAEGQAPLADGELHTARFGVCVGLAALVGVLSGVGGKPFLQVGVVGADMD